MPDQIPVFSVCVAMGRAKRNPVKAYLSTLAASSRGTQLDAVCAVARLLTGNPRTRPDRLAWHRVTFETAVRVRAALSDRYAPATANRMIAALRGVLRASWRVGLMSSEAYRRAADVPRVRGGGLLKGRALGASELEKLYGVCAADDGAAGARDGAVIALLHAAGLRRAEAVALDVASVDLRTGAVVVMGKGRKKRTVYLGDGLAWVETWLDARGPEPGPLLLKLGSGERLSERAVLSIVQARAREAGLEETTPHDLRRTFATSLMDGGVDMRLVQALMGHASMDTTGRYDRRGEDAKARAQRRLVVPRIGGVR